MGLAELTRGYKTKKMSSLTDFGLILESHIGYIGSPCKRQMAHNESPRPNQNYTSLQCSTQLPWVGKMKKKIKKCVFCRFCHFWHGKTLMTTQNCKQEPSYEQGLFCMSMDLVTGKKTGSYFISFFFICSFFYGNSHFSPFLAM